MKRKLIRILSLTVVLITLLSSVFTLYASAQTWIIQSEMSLEDISLKAELYNGVLNLKIQSGDGKSTSASLEMFMMAKIPWKDPSVRMTIKEVYFGSGITSLAGADMLYLHNAKILHIPTSVKSLGGKHPFSMMLELEKIYYGGSKSQWEKLSEGIDFSSSIKDVEIIFESSDSERECDESWEVGYYNKSDVIASRVGDTVYLEGRGMMEDYKLGEGGTDDLAPWVRNKDIKHVIICDGVRNVGDYAFWGNSAIEDVVIAGSVSTIGIEAFYGTSLKEVNIPASVTEIKKGAFGSCGSLTTVCLTQNTGVFGDGVFGGCKSLEKINFGGSKYYWDRIEFGDNAELKSVTVVCNYVPEKGSAKPFLSSNPTASDSEKESEAESNTEIIEKSTGSASTKTASNEKDETKTDLSVAVIALSVSTSVMAILVAFLLILFIKKKKSE